MTVTNRFFLGVMAVATLTTACEQPGDVQIPPPSPDPVFVDVKTEITHVSGYVWDPEAFWMTVAECGPECPFPPLTVPGIPGIERSLIGGAHVSLFDPIANHPTFEAPGATGPDGVWAIEHVTSRTEVPFLAVVGPPAPGSDALRPIDPPFLTPVPKANYLPTLVLKPIFTAYTECPGQSAPLASDKGVLEAVARHLTAIGKPTTVMDLIDPSKFGGVLVTWLFTPGDPPLRVPAFGTALEVSRGQVLNIDWAPPGALPPELNPSTRGFYVNTQSPVSPIGLTVVLLDPVMGPPEPIQITPVDPSQDEGHPFKFPPLPPMVVPPGLISYEELPALNGAPTPQWVCLDPFGN